MGDSSLSSSLSLSSSSSSSSSSFSFSDLEMGLQGTTLATESNYSSMEPPPLHPTTATGFFVDDPADEEPRHFLDACSLCRRPLGANRDIYMYRGDTPFCSEECRQEQIEMDEAMEKSWKLTSFKKASSPIRDQKGKSSSSSPKARGIHIRASTVVAG